jgi:site-specific DNA recombinase
MMKRIKAGLARVSTDRQKYGVALTNQIQRLRAAGCERVYADVASRTDEHRDGVEALLAAVKAGEIESVTVTTLDRATGSPALLDRLTKILSQYGVTLHGLDESIDIVSEGGEIMAGISVVMAKGEVRKIRARSQRGHDAKKRNNRPNAVVPFGYAARDRQYVFDSALFLCLIATKNELSKRDLAQDTIALFRETKSLTAAVKAVHSKYGIYPRAQGREIKASKSFVLGVGDSLGDLTTARIDNRSRFSWTHKGLRNWLFNPVLRGHTAYGTRKVLGLDDSGRRKFSGTLPQEQWDIRRNTHPEVALLTEEDYLEFKSWLEINSLSRANTHQWMNKSTLRYAISGLIYCGECGGKCGSQGTKKRQGKTFSYYKCRNAMGSTGRRVSGSSCSQFQTVRSDRIEAAIISRLVEEAAALNQFANEPDRLAAVLPSPELAKLKEQLAGLQALGQNPVITAAIEELKLQVERLSFAEKSEATELVQIKEDFMMVFGQNDFWEFALAEVEGKTKLFNRFVERVTTRDGVIIEVRLKL